jgi:hypothetical protein
MLLIREVFHCRPGKVRPLADKFLAMAKLPSSEGMGKMRVMTEMEKIMEGYHDLIDSGHREIYKIEG